VLLQSSPLRKGPSAPAGAIGSPKVRGRLTSARYRNFLKSKVRQVQRLHDLQVFIHAGWGERTPFPSSAISSFMTMLSSLTNLKVAGTDRSDNSGAGIIFLSLCVLHLTGIGPCNLKNLTRIKLLPGAGKIGDRVLYAWLIAKRKNPGSTCPRAACRYHEVWS